MRKLFRLKPRDPKVPSPGLEPAKVILTFVASLGEGAVSVPGLKAAAQIVIRIVEIAQKVQSNQADCLIIAERAQQLMEAMIESLGDQNESDVHPRLKEDLARFENDLKGILEILEPLANPSRTAKVFKHMEHSQELLQAKETLDHSFRRFQVYNTIAIRLSVDDIVRGQSQKSYRTYQAGGDGMSTTEKVADIGFTELAGGHNMLVDIVLVHGLQGHPKKTWTKPNVRVKCESWADGKYHKEYVIQDVYWPQDLLQKDFPQARILVYGYDSKVSRFFRGTEGHSSFLGYARSLLDDLVFMRMQAPTRPLIFISHSLGGILVKEVLRQSELDKETDDFAEYETISKSTAGIVFMGTPHHTGTHGSLGETVENILKNLDFGTNEEVLQDLHKNVEALSFMQEEFMKLLDSRAPFLTVYSLQEAKAANGSENNQGLTEKVVDEASSTLNHRYEIVRKVQANHWDICKFEGGIGVGGYSSVWSAVYNYLERIRAPPWVDVGTPTVNIPFPRDPFFVGRESELAALDSALFDVTSAYSEAAIVGLGGIGKTQTAIEYAYRLGEKQAGNPNGVQRSIFWLHASSQARIEEGFKEIAKTIQLNKQYGDDVFPIVKDWFQSSASGDWLLILDNADEEGVFFDEFISSRPLLHTSKTRRVCDYLPQKANCAILYTSRHRICAQRLTSRSRHGKIFSLSTMSPAESMKLVENELQSSIGEGELMAMQSSTELLVNVLDNLPLALVQAAAFMKENGLTPAAYLELYQQVEAEQAAFLEEEFVDWRRDSDMSNSVLLAWKVSFEQIKRKDERAARLLSILSILDRHEIPTWILAYLPDMSRLQLTKALSLLQSFSLIEATRQGSGGAWRMHRLVQLATRVWIGSATWEGCVQHALRLLCDAFMGLHWGDEVHLIKQSLEYYPHTKSVLAALSTVRNSDQTDQTMGEFFSGFRPFRLTSQEFAAKALSVYEGIASGDHNSLREMGSFVSSLSNGSIRAFEYVGVRPRESGSIYR